MTSRTVGGSSYTLSYDRGNRLIGVSGPSTSAIFLYDADGNRVLATVNGATTVYIAGLFEYTGGAATSYYGGAAMRRSSYGSGNGVFYVLADHLGSTSAIVDTSGSVQAQQYYYPYGTNRSGAQSDLTDKRYTGQYHESGLAGTEGLYYYNARWYDPALARFMQADTIVPQPGNPQALNRYAYGLNNPVKYNDPSGHSPVSWLIQYVSHRVGTEAITVVVPELDRARRDYVGGGLVTSLESVIQRDSLERGADPTVVAAILRHESAATERRMLTPTMASRPGLIADIAEAAQYLVLGDKSSIGPAQMQVRFARDLEQLGYVQAQPNELATVCALLDIETSVLYVVAATSYIDDHLQQLYGASYGSLSGEERQRLQTIGYNSGWSGRYGLEANMHTHGAQTTISISEYDNETLDEYFRWRER
jgi:RHS repeat-associated protein